MSKSFFEILNEYDRKLREEKEKFEKTYEILGLPKNNLERLDKENLELKQEKLK